MNCRSFQDRLAELHEGKLAADERRAVDAHVAACSGCREFVALLRLDVPAAGTVDLTSAVLERTSGAACVQAHEFLCDHVDRALERLDGELVTLHLAGCRDCSALAAALLRLSGDLPLLAELSPAEDFVAGVLARTTGRASRSRRLAGWAERAVLGLLARPRIAWEAGYVGAMAIWLAASVFGAPFHAELPLPGAEAPARYVRHLRGSVEAAGSRTWEVAGEAGLAAMKSGLRAGCRRTAAVFDEIGREGGELAQAAFRFDTGDASDALEELTQRARGAWEQRAAKGHENRDPND